MFNLCHENVVLIVFLFHLSCWFSGSCNLLWDEFFRQLYQYMSLFSGLCISGVRLQQKFTHTQAFKRLGAKLIKSVHPLCKHLPEDSDDYWRCFIRSNTLTMYHPTSTCKMGRKEDNTTVVDSQLRLVCIPLTSNTSLCTTQ